MIYVGSIGTPKELIKGSSTSSITGDGEGVYSIKLNKDGSCKMNVSLSDNAGTLCLSPDKKHVYVANESRNFFHGINASGGGVTAYSVQEDGTLKKLNESISYGSRPCFVSISVDGKYLLVANHGSHSNSVCRYVQDENGEWKLERQFDDSSIAVFEIMDDGSIGHLSDLKVFDGKGYWIYKGGQEASHIHCVKIRKDNLVVACNRGCDEIEILKLQEGKLELLHQYKTKAGLAPRYVEFHPNKNVVYVLNENYAFITIYKIDPTTGEMQEMGEIATMDEVYMQEHPLPILAKKNQELGEQSSAAMGNKGFVMPSDIHISENGTYLYVSNRRKTFHGSIAVYKILSDGMLELKTIMDLKGEDPRGFNLSKDGEYLGCALMDINEVQIFKIDKAEGIPEKMAYSIHVNSPSALIMTD